MRGRLWSPDRGSELPVKAETVLQLERCFISADSRLLQAVLSLSWLNLLSCSSTVTDYHSGCSQTNKNKSNLSKNPIKNVDFLHTSDLNVHYIYQIISDPF